MCMCGIGHCMVAAMHDVRDESKTLIHLFLTSAASCSMETYLLHFF